MLTVRATLGGRASQLARRALSARAHGGTFSPALFRNDSTVWSAWLVASSGPQAEVIASQGCDAVVIDCQHGIYTTESMVSMLQAVSAAPAPQPAAIVRVSQCNAAEMTKALDAGATKKKLYHDPTRQCCSHFSHSAHFPPYATPHSSYISPDISLLYLV